MSTATTSHWEHFHHQADVGVRGVGPTPAAALEQAAVAMTAVILPPTQVVARRAVPISCEAPGLEVLLVDWLNELVYEMAVRRMLFSRFEVRLDGLRLHGTAWGEPVDVERHQPAVEVKGATMTALAVRQERDGTWIAQCVVDV